MVRGSRLIPVLFSEIKISAVRQMEETEEKTHHGVGIGVRADPIGYSPGKKKATAQDQAPPKKLHSSRQEKAGGVKGAAVENHPGLRQPKQRHNPGDLGRNGFGLGEFNQDDQSNDGPGDQRWKHGLCNAARRWRPEGFRLLQSLAPHEKK